MSSFYASSLRHSMYFAEIPLRFFQPIIHLKSETSIYIASSNCSRGFEINSKFCSRQNFNFPNVSHVFPIISHDINITVHLPCRLKLQPFPYKSQVSFSGWAIAHYNNKTHNIVLHASSAHQNSSLASQIINSTWIFY